MMKLTANDIRSEVGFTTSRSGGPGGQNVNKVNSKVTLKWDVAQSLILRDDQKEIITRKLASYITKDGVLVLTAQESRSQLQNKEAAINKLDSLLTRAFAVKKPRKATKPTKGSTRKRIEQKKQRAEKKQWRKKL